MPPASIINVPATVNPAWGFHGGIAHHADAGSAWPIAMAAIADATGCVPDDVRAFLDSRHGRHFADDVANALTGRLPLADAIAAALRKWMDWTIGGAIAREHGIPRGLPYLSGFVMVAAIEVDTAADRPALPAAPSGCSRRDLGRQRRPMAGCHRQENSHDRTPDQAFRQRPRDADAGRHPRGPADPPAGTAGRRRAAGRAHFAGQRPDRRSARAGDTTAGGMAAAGGTPVLEAPRDAPAAPARATLRQAAQAVLGVWNNPENRETDNATALEGPIAAVQIVLAGRALALDGITGAHVSPFWSWFAGGGSLKSDRWSRAASQRGMARARWSAPRQSRRR